MELRWLQDFLTVAETGNFTTAASTRNVSQAAFSRRIQALEQWLGVSLIDRSTFPTRLTTEGERFRDQAGEIVEQMLSARQNAAGLAGLGGEMVRVALPHALATSVFTDWWREWSEGLGCTVHVDARNVHDSVTAFVAGAVDLLICFHNPEQPVHLDPRKYERIAIGDTMLRPYASPELHALHAAHWPGAAARPMPLLMYSPWAYLGRMVEMIAEKAGEALAGRTLLESDMADVLCRFAIAGHGIAWLPEPTAKLHVDNGRLLPMGAANWTLQLAVVAYRDTGRRRPTIDKVWNRLARTSAVPIPPPRRINNGFMHARPTEKR
jgi:LysR family transcriptional regulator, hypochlorite-specific transcription factor HypT